MKLELGSVFWMNDDGGGHFYVVITRDALVDCDYQLHVERAAQGPNLSPPARRARSSSNGIRRGFLSVPELKAPSKFRR